MQSKILLALFSAIFIVSGCSATSLQVGGEIQQGRRALLRGDPKAALPYFQSAAERDPNYLINFAPLTEGVWTYNGRAYYEMNQFGEARKSFERALSRTEEDYFARLYLGMVLGREGDRQRGHKEVDTALKGFHSSLDYIVENNPDGNFWDSTGELRSAIRKQLASLSVAEPNWPEVIASGEWLGQQLEEEIDLSRMIKQRKSTRDSESARDND